MGTASRAAPGPAAREPLGQRTPPPFEGAQLAFYRDLRVRMLLKCEKVWGKTLEFPALVTINTGTAGPGSEELYAPPFTILDKKRQRRLTQPCCSRFKPWAVLGWGLPAFLFGSRACPRGRRMVVERGDGEKLWRNLILAAAVQFIDRKGIVMRWSAVPVKPMGSYLVRWRRCLQSPFLPAQSPPQHLRR